MEQKKPWYNSKIVRIAAIGIISLVTNHLTGWVSIQATPSEIESIMAIDPAIGETVQAVKNGENWLTAGGSLLFAVIAAIRIWFTTKKLE